MLIGRKIKMLERIFFPNVCPICETVIRAKEIICRQCVDKLKIVKEPRCQKCGKQLQTDERLFCNDCNERVHIFDKGVCIFEYSEEMKQTIYRFKYNNKRCYRDLFGYMGAKIYGKILKEWKVERIMPVPMYHKKRQARGYNQAEEFGKALSEYTGIEMDCESLVRIKDTKPQKGLNKEERHMNLQKPLLLN